MFAHWNLELGDVSYSISKRTTRHREVEIKFPVCRIVWIKGHAEQALLAGGREQTLSIEKRFAVYYARS